MAVQAQQKTSLILSRKDDEENSKKKTPRHVCNAVGTRGVVWIDLQGKIKHRQNPFIFMCLNFC